MTPTTAIRPHDGAGIYADAAGNLYPQGTIGTAIGTCPVPGNVLPLTDRQLIRMTPAGSIEAVGSFVDRCDVGFAVLVNVEGIETDPVRGALLATIQIDHRAGSSGASQNEFIVEITGLPRVADIVPEGPQGPQGEPGPAGSQGPPGPLLTPCPDADADGFRDCVTIPGCFTYGAACGDCDDTNPTINPRGSERRPPRNRRDGKDNDCNGVVDG